MWGGGWGAMGFRARNCAIARATGSGRWMCRRWPTPSIVHSSTCGSDEREGSRRPRPTAAGSRAPSTDRTGRSDRGGLLGAELPLGEGGQLDAEEGVGVLDRLRDHAGNPLLEQGSAGCPVEAAHGAHEHGERARVVAARVGLEHRAGLLEEGLAAGQREAATSSSRISVCTRSGWSRASWAATAAPLEWPAMWARRNRDGRATRRRRRRGRRRSPAAGCACSDPAALVVADQLVAVGERRLREER